MTPKQLISHVNSNIQNGRAAGHGLLWNGKDCDVTCPSLIDWGKPDIYGLKPLTVIVNGHEVKAGETEIPDGVMTYTADPYDASYFTEDRSVVLHNLDRGIVFLNEEDAIAMAKAMLDFKFTSPKEASKPVPDDQDFLGE